MKQFHAVVLIVFVALALLGVFIFATFTVSRQDVIGEVAVWGSLPTAVVDKYFGHVRDSREDFGSVTYTEFPEDELVPRLVEAIAAGRGPDLVFFPASAWVKDGEKLASIPYSSFSRREFQDTFVEAGEVFLREDGVAAFPVVIDPMVTYWNRTLFSNAAVAAPPRYWDDVALVAQKITERSDNGSITVSAVALGGWGNVAYAKETLTSLMRQLGSDIVSVGPDGNYVANLVAERESSQPAVSAVRFFVDFADPVKPMYSWNRSLKNSRDAFLDGTLAMYFAPASELLALRAANPNLNFDVAPLPVARGAGQAISARIVGLAVPRGAKNPSGAATAAVVLSSQPEAAYLASLMTLPATRRDVVLDTSADPYLSVFQSAALRSFVFLDPDPVRSDQAFERMIENISSGRTTLSEAVSEAQDELSAILGE